jgi:hypothetical protein
MSTLQERAMRIYGKSGTEKPAQQPTTEKPAQPTTAATDSPPAHHHRLYGKGGDYRHGIESYFARHEAALAQKGDKENLAKARAARADLEAFARKRNMSASDVHIALSALHDHEMHTRGQAAIEARRKRTWEQLCESHGGEQAARAALQGAAKFQEEFKAEVPYLAERMIATAAVEAPEILDVCIKHGEPVSITKEQ